MKITFFSNFLNHHQLPVCQELLGMPGIEFKFVATTQIPEERVKFGYEDMNQRDFVLRDYDSPEAHAEALRLARESDITIHGSTTTELIEETIRSGKPFFRYNERFFKKVHPLKLPYSILRYKGVLGGKKNSKAHMLCASAFTSADMKLIGAYKNQCYKWGYFPDVSIYDDIDALIEKKKPNSILWVARMLALKHPEAPVLVAERLKAEGYEFTVNMIGIGEREEEIKELVARKGLENEVKFLGSMSPEKVREYMEEARIFLFTSDKQEGWGAVLNESMNSGCAVAASHAIGSVPFLLKDGENGMIYRDGDCEDLYKKVKYMLDNPDETTRMGKAAYKTLAEQWNAKNAAARFVELAKAIIGGEFAPDIFADGVCSKAEVLKNNWY